MKPRWNEDVTAVKARMFDMHTILAVLKAQAQSELPLFPPDATFDVLKLFSAHWRHSAVHRVPACVSHSICHKLCPFGTAEFFWETAKEVLMNRCLPDVNLSNY